MKKLFALMLTLCLMLGVALAEEEAPQLNWADVLAENPALEENGTYQQITFAGTDAKLIYWVPNDLPALDVSTITGSPVAAFGAMDPEDGQVYYMAVYALDVNYQDYAADQQTKGADLDKAQLVITNGIQVISLENPVEDIDMAIAPATDNLTLVFAFYPLNNELWDEVKGYIVSSIQLAQ